MTTIKELIEFNAEKFPDKDFLGTRESDYDDEGKKGKINFYTI